MYYTAGIAVAGDGSVYVSDNGNNRIRRVDVAGRIDTIAGNGTAISAADGVLATSAGLDQPYGVAIDNEGRVYIGRDGHRVRRIEIDGTMSTVAGTGAIGFSGDDGPAMSAGLANPNAVALDDAGQVLIADTGNDRIRVVSTQGIVRTVAGIGERGSIADGAPATSTALSYPAGVAVDAMGRLLVADQVHRRIRRVNLDGSMTTIAGNGAYAYRGDGGLARQAKLKRPMAVAVDGEGNIFIADIDCDCVRKVTLDGIIHTIAGNGSPGFTGDNGPAILSQLNQPLGIAADALGNVFIADRNNQRIRRIDGAGTITTVAGTGQAGFNGDGSDATTILLNAPTGVAIDQTGALLIADTGNARIRRVDASGIVTIVGGGADSGEQVAALDARLSGPSAIAVDTLGRLLIADDQIRRVDQNGLISTIAGSGNSVGDGALATNAGASSYGIAVDTVGRIYLSNTNSHRIRQIDTDGIITTVAGLIDSPTNGPVASANLTSPSAFVVTPQWTLFASGVAGTVEAIADSKVATVAGRYPQTIATGDLARFRSDKFGSIGGIAYQTATGSDPAIIYITEASVTSNRLHAITVTDPTDKNKWTIATLASGTAGFADGPAATARFRAPTGLFLDSTTRTLYIADTGNHAIRALNLATRTVTTVVNAQHALGFAGDGAAAGAALLYRPSTLTRCGNGDLFIADTGNNRIRRIAATTGIISTVLGDGIPASSGEGFPSSTFPVDQPRGLACDAVGNLIVSSSTTVRLLAANSNGIVDGAGTVQTIYGAPPRASFPSSSTGCLTGLAVTGPATVQVADACTGLLVELNRQIQ
jgi:sugar lactone lactonase YvrE